MEEKNYLTKVNNKRRTMRYKLRSAENLKLFYSLNNNNTYYPCEIYDFSKEGAGLRLSQYIEVDDVIYLFIQDNSEQFKFKSLVVNSSGLRVGVSFLDLDEFQVTLIDDVINRYFYSINAPKKLVLNS